MSFWGNVLGAGISTLGGMHANRQNVKLNREGRAHQEHLLKNQLQWRMEDARKAGVSPSVALGGSVVGSGTSSPIPMQNELHAMGQGVGRALSSGATAFQKKQQALNLENMALQNDLLKTQVAASKARLAGQPGIAPPFPSHLNDDQPTSDIITSKLPPSASSVDNLVADVHRALAAPPRIVREEVIGSAPDNPLRTAGHKAPVSFIRTANGFQMIPSKDAKEGIEDSLWDEMSWRYNVVRNAYKYQPPKKYLKLGHRWYFNPMTLTFSQVKIGSKNKWYNFH